MKCYTYIWFSNKVFKIRYLTGIESVSGFTMKVTLKCIFNIIFNKYVISTPHIVMLVNRR